MTTIFGVHDANTLEQMAAVASTASRTALMADGHFGYIMPVGGVAGYVNHVSCSGVGFDIACGNAAIRTNLRAANLTGEWDRLAAAVARAVSFGLGRSNAADDAPVDHPLFDDPRWNALPAGVNVGALKAKARAQLGTVGSGNHYVDVFVSETDEVWVGVHFGSRGLGHTVASGFMSVAQGQAWDARLPEQDTLLDLSTPLGDGYWAMMTLCGDYAYAGREWVARKVVSILGGTEVELVHNHHNFAWTESHGGEKLIVVRKGATPAFPGQRGFVGGSMGDVSVILEGVESARSPDALYSTVHGAGRVMSRTAAAGNRYKDKKARTRAQAAGTPLVEQGAVSQAMMDEWITREGVILRGGGRDESPHVYRRLPDVLAAQGDTIRVLHTLRPKIVVMAGADEFDPYKD